MNSLLAGLVCAVLFSHGMKAGSLKNHYMMIAVVMGIGLFALAMSHPASADRSDDKATCASKYPNAPTEPPPGYRYNNEDDAYMVFRREARKAGYTAVKKVKHADVKDGPCVDHGKHVNMHGARRSANGKKTDWGYIGSMTSCEICEDTSRGPRLYNTVWRIHPEL